MRRIAQILDEFTASHDAQKQQKQVEIGGLLSVLNRNALFVIEESFYRYVHCSFISSRQIISRKSNITIQAVKM